MADENDRGLRHEYRVAPDNWTIRYRTPSGFPVRKNPKGGISFDLPVSPKCDPDATPPWAGYVTMQEPKNLIEHGPGVPLVGTHLVYQFNVTATPGTQFNFMSDSNNLDGKDPAAFRPFLKQNAWDHMGLPDRWWNNSSKFTLKNSGPLETLDVSLDPALWTDVDGTPAAASPVLLGYFKQALARPSYIGWTFGGGNYYGHGVNCFGGQCTVNLYRLYSY